MNLPPTKPPTQVKSGFSLIELVVAMSIVCIGLIPLLGVMSIGLNQLTTIKQRSSVSRIFTCLESKAQSIPFKKIQEAVGVYHYFDQQGVETQSTQNALYRATFDSLPLSLPGSESAPTNEKGKRLKVRVEFIPGGKPVEAQTQYKFLYVTDLG